MDEPNPSSDPMDGLHFSLSAALSKQYAADQRQFLSLLANMFETSLPEESEVKWRGGFFSKKSLQSVGITLGDHRYALEDGGHGPLRATLTRIVRGIALKTEEMPVPEWIDTLSAALEERTGAHADACEALSKLVG